MLNELEKKIYDVQLSTRTTFPEFSSVHNNLRLKFRWYYYWHTNRLSSLVHTILLILFTAGSFLSIYNIFVPNSKAIDSDSITLTSQEEWQDGTGNNIDYDTTPGDMTIDLEQKAYSLTDIPDESIIESGDPTTSGKNNITDGNTESYWQFSNATASTSANVVIDIGELIEINQLDVYSWCPAMEYECQILTSTDNVSYSFLGSAGGLLEGETVFTGSRITRYLKISASSVGYEGYEAQARINEIILSAKILGAQHITDTTQLDGNANLSSWTTFASNASVPENSSLSYRFRTSSDALEWSDWSESTAHSAEIDLVSILGETDSAKRYLQISATFSSTDGLSTPTISDYTVNYEYDDTPTPTCDDGIQNGDETGVDCGGSCSACPSDGECEVGETEQTDGVLITDKSEWQEQTYNNKIIDTETSPGSVKLLQGKDGYMSGYFGFCNGTGVGTYTNTLNSWDSLFFQFPIDVENFPDDVTSARLKLYMTHGFWAGGTPADPRYVPYSLSTISSQWLENPMTCPPTGGATFNSATLDMLQFNECYGQWEGMMGEGSCFSDFWPNTYYSFELGGGTPEQVAGKWAGFGFRLSATHLDGFQFYMREQSVNYPPVIEINFANGETWNVNLPIQTGTQSGTILSAPTQLDGGENFSGWTTFNPSATIPANTSITFRFRTSADATNWSSWSASTPYAASIDISGLDNYRYLQVESTLANTDGASTPFLHEYSANYSYCVEDITPPTCDDGIQNGDETGVDCGGSCPPCDDPEPEPTCFDGIQNQGETGIDCGGPCPACETEPYDSSDSDSSDEDTYIHEETSQPATKTTKTSTCSDGVQDGDETGIDCGGNCPECIIDTLQLTVTIIPPLPKVNTGDKVDYLASSTLSDGTDVTSNTEFDFYLSDGGVIENVVDNKITVKAGNIPKLFKEAITVTGRYRNLSDTQKAGIEIIQKTESDKKAPICDSIWCEILDMIKEIVRGILSPYSNFFTNGLLFSIIAALLSLTSNLISLIRSLRFYSAFIKGKNKRLDKSVVYDAQTGSVIPKSKIELIDKEHNILEAVTVSDKDGKFSINLSPGKKYLIKVEKDNYQQISSNDYFNTMGLTYQNNYFGEEFFAKEDETMFIKNIPLKLEYSSDKKFSIRRQTSIIRVLVMLNFVIYFVGLFYSLIATLIDPGLYNYAVILLYIITALLFLIRHLFIDGKTFGTVMSSLQPVDLAVVRAVHKDSSILVKTVVSDIKGRYSMALPKGNYQIKASKTDLIQKDEINISVNNSFEPRQEILEMISVDDSAGDNTNPTSSSVINDYDQSPIAKHSEQITTKNSSSVIEHQLENNDENTDTISDFADDYSDNSSDLGSKDISSTTEDNSDNDLFLGSISHDQVTGADDIIENYYKNKDS